MLNNYMCKKKKVIAYFVETKDKDLFIENETFVKYFPKIKGKEHFNLNKLLLKINVLKHS